MLHQRMAAILSDAYAHPGRRAFYYTCMTRDTTGSARLNGMPFWDWNPQPPFPLPLEAEPPEGTQAIPVAFGCPVSTTSEGRFFCKPIIREPAQVKDLAIPDVRAGRLGKHLEYLRKIRDLLPDGYTARTFDALSPLSVANLIWDESFYIALYDHPQAVHDLLDKITTFIIRYLNATYEAISETRVNPTACPPLWARCKGYYISDDTMSLVSPEMHLEFSVPYINRITESCGPVCYHSCTWRRKYFDNLHQLKNVLVFNWNPGNSDDPAIIIREFSGTAVLAPHLVHNMHKDNDVLRWNPHFADESDFFKYYLDNMQDNTTMFFWFSNIVENGPVMDKIYDLLDEHAYTVRAHGLV